MNGRKMVKSDRHKALYHLEYTAEALKFASYYLHDVAEILAGKCDTTSICREINSALEIVLAQKERVESSASKMKQEIFDWAKNERA